MLEKSNKTSSTTDLSSLPALSSYLSQTHDTLTDTLIKEQKNRTLTLWRKNPCFPDDEPETFLITPGNIPQSQRVPTKSDDSKNQKIGSLVCGILMLAAGTYLTIKSYQQRQHVIAYLKNTQTIANAIKQSGFLFGKAIAEIEKSLVDALTNVVTIQPKYCDAKIVQLSKCLLSGVFLTVSGFLFTAHCLAKKGWLEAGSTAAFGTSVIFGMLGFAFKDPRSLSEITQLKESIAIAGQFLKNIG